MDDCGGGPQILLMYLTTFMYLILLLVAAVLVDFVVAYMYLLGKQWTGVNL